MYGRKIRNYLRDFPVILSDLKFPPYAIHQQQCLLDHYEGRRHLFPKAFLLTTSALPSTNRIPLSSSREVLLEEIKWLPSMPAASKVWSLIILAKGQITKTVLILANFKKTKQQKNKIFLKTYRKYSQDVFLFTASFCSGFKIRFHDRVLLY